MNKWHAHVFAAITVAIMCASGAADALRTAIVDWRFTAQKNAPSGQVAIVAIDAPSIHALGVWPWPRTVYAELLDKLRAAGATDVAFDIDFSSPSTPAADARFARALESFGGGAILPVFKQIVRGSGHAPRVHASAPIPEFAHHAWLATVNIVPDKGIARNYPLGETIEGYWYPSLAALLTGHAGQQQSFTIDYSLDPKRIPVFSVLDILDGRVATELKGRKLIVGATAIELGDRFTVPVHGTITGVELQAVAAEAILGRRTMQESSTLVTAFGLALIALLAIGLGRLLSTIHASLILLGVAACIEAGATVLQSHAIVIVDTSVWHIAIAFSILAYWLQELDLRRLLAAVAQRKFQTIAMTLGDGVICTDARGIVTFWNPAAVSIFDCSGSRAIGRPITEFIRTENTIPDASSWLAAAETQAVLEFVGIRADGTTFPIEVRLSSWESETERQFSAIVRDISVRRRNEERIRFLALNDPLSGLANRAQLRDHIKDRTEDSATQRFTVLTLDLDNFKDVNDALGHEGGDKLLREFASQLSNVAPSGSLAARLGGDEFAIVTEATGADLADLTKSIADIFGTGDRLTYVEGRAFALSTSLGSAEYPRDGSTVDELLSNSDIALYRAKNAGGARYIAYEPAFKWDLDHRRTLETELRSALADGQLELYYQPQVRLADDRLVGAEALLRWRHPRRGLLVPADFVAILGASNLASAAGEWILRTACRQGAAWHARGQPLCIGVNLFPCQFTAQLPAQIESALREASLPAHLLEIEITENILLSNNAMTVQLLSDIRRLGVRVALDDFGTGYASLTHLKRFPLDRLKIDRSFVAELGSDETNTAIVEAVVALSKRIGLSTIAEGIEDQQCQQMLKALGCDEGQGYLFGKPLPATEINRLIENDARPVAA